MITVAAAVASIVASSDFAIEGLQTGCLNYSEYAKSVHPEVERLAKKPVQRGSIVMALSRLGREYYGQNRSEKFTFHNLANRTGLTEITYTKSSLLQSRLVDLYRLEQIRMAPFFVSITGLSEISVVTHSNLISLVQDQLSDVIPTLLIDKLASLTMQVDAATIDTPRQSYSVIKQLALRDISIVEYITSPTELTIIVRDEHIKQAFTILYDQFFSSRSDTRHPYGTDHRVKNL